jgi:hypothetical protein
VVCPVPMMSMSTATVTWSPVVKSCTSVVPAIVAELSFLSGAVKPLVMPPFAPPRLWPVQLLK